MSDGQEAIEYALSALSGGHAAAVAMPMQRGRLGGMQPFAGGARPGTHLQQRGGGGMQPNAFAGGIRPGSQHQQRGGGGMWAGGQHGAGIGGGGTPGSVRSAPPDAAEHGTPHQKTRTKAPTMIDRVGLARHPKKESILKGMGTLRLTARVSKVSSKGKGNKLNERVLVLTDSFLCDFDESSYKCLHQVKLEHVRAYSTATDNSEAFIVYVDHNQDPKTKDFLMASKERDLICKFIAKACRHTTKTVLAVDEWVATYTAEKTLMALLGSDMHSVGAGAASTTAASSSSLDNEGEMVDEVGLSRHPKSANILKGLGTLRLTAKVSKASGRGKSVKLKDRVLVLTDTYLCDCDATTYKVMHQVKLEHLKSYSVPENNGEALIIYVDHNLDSKTKNFLIVSKDRENLCKIIARAYKQQMTCDLAADEWVPRYDAETTLAALIGPTILTGTSDASTVGELSMEQDSSGELVDEIGLARHPKKESILKGMGTLRLTARVSKVSSKGKGNKLNERVLVLTDSFLCDFDESSYKCLHQVKLEHVRAYSTATDNSEAFIVYVDHNQDPKTKDFLMASKERDLICKFIAKACRHTTKTVLAVDEWVATYTAEKTLMALLGSDMHSVGAGAASTTAASSSSLDNEGEMVDEVGLSRHPKSANILKGLGTLRLTAKVSKASGRGKSVKLKDRVLVLTDTYLCDCDATTYKVMHQVKLEHISEYSTTGGQSRALIIYVDHNQDSTKDFLLVTDDCDMICVQLTQAFEQLTQQSLRYLPWREKYPHEQTIAAVTSVLDTGRAHAADDRLVAVEGDSIGLCRHPKVGQILKKGDVLELAVKMRKVDKNSKLKDRVLVVTDTYLCDVDEASYKCKHRIRIEHISGYTLSPDNDDAFILYIDQTALPKTKDFLLASADRERICTVLENRYEQILNRSLVRRQWMPSFYLERTLSDLTSVQADMQSLVGGDKGFFAKKVAQAADGMLSKHLGALAPAIAQVEGAIAAQASAASIAASGAGSIPGEMNPFSATSTVASGAASVGGTIPVIGGVASGPGSSRDGGAFADNPSRCTIVPSIPGVARSVAAGKIRNIEMKYQVGLGIMEDALESLHSVSSAATQEAGLLDAIKSIEDKIQASLAFFQDFSEKLLDSLDECLDSDDAHCMIGKAMTSLPQHLMDSIRQHIDSLLQTVMRLKELEQTYPLIGEHLGNQIRTLYETETQGLTACDLYSMLQSPKVQVQEYIRLLTEIISVTPESHPDYEASCEALSNFKSVHSGATGQAQADSSRTPTQRPTKLMAPDSQQRLKLEELENQLALSLESNEALEAQLARDREEQANFALQAKEAETRAAEASEGMQRALEEVAELRQQILSNVSISSQQSESAAGDLINENQELKLQQASLLEAAKRAEAQMAAAEQRISQQRLKLEELENQLALSLESNEALEAQLARDREEQANFALQAKEAETRAAEASEGMQRALEEVAELQQQLAGAQQSESDAGVLVKENLAMKLQIANLNGTVKDFEAAEAGRQQSQQVRIVQALVNPYCVATPHNRCSMFQVI